jgi:hypothetical protein
MDVIRRTQAVCKRGIALLNLFESNRHTFLEHIHHDRYYEHRVKDARLNLSSRSGVWRRDGCSRFAHHIIDLASVAESTSWTVSCASLLLSPMLYEAYADGKNRQIAGTKRL